MVVVKCVDTGIGIPAEDQLALFTRFFRASNANAEQIQGTGLGLAISRAIVEGHGGSIAVASILGTGTTCASACPGMCLGRRHRPELDDLMASSLLEHGEALLPHARDEVQAVPMTRPHRAVAVPRPRRCARGLVAAAALAMGTPAIAAASTRAASPAVAVPEGNAATTQAATAATAGPAAVRPGGVPTWAGQPIPASNVVGSSVAGAARAYRLSYLSTGLGGQPIVVSGLVYTPKGKAPRRGWPVVGWAHGTTGIADACAPSATKDAAGYGPYLTRWLAKGYAVAATDYEGLGTPGRHPYLIGDSEGRSVIDMVRAARRYDHTISARWFAIGHSQGGQAALFAGKLQATYGAGLNYRGTIAVAPPTQWKGSLISPAMFTPKAPVNPFLLFIVSGLHAVRPTDFPYDQLLTPAGRTYLDRAETNDCGAVFNALKGKTMNEVFAVDADEGTRIATAMAQLGEPPATGYRRPILLVQGAKDDIVVPAATRTTAAAMRAAKTDATLAWYPNASHENILAASLPVVMRWAAARVR